MLCSGCSGVNSFGQTNDGLKTYPYAPPLVDFVGRYVDSQMTGNFQNVGIRTLRARSIRTFPQPNGTAPPRIYIQMGNAVGGYALDTFFSSRLPGGLKSAKEIARSIDRWGAPYEKLAVWDGYVYPEASASGWYAPLIDKQDPMGKGGAFDLDDRGYLYSTHMFGWGIAKDDGRTNAAHLPKVLQMVSCSTKATGTVCPATQISPITGKEEPFIPPATYPNTRNDDTSVSGQSIVALRIGSKYYAVIAGGSKSHAVFDVTDPTEPVLIATRPGNERSMLRYDRSDAFSRIAYVDANKRLHVYTYTNLVNGADAIGTYAAQDGGFTDVSIDESGNIWAIESARVLKLTPAGAGYVPSDFTPFGSDFTTMKAISAAGGHLAVMGTARTASGFKFDVRLAKIEAGGPRQIALDGFFMKYYHSAEVGYAEPGQYVQPFDVELVKWGGKTYLLYSAEGLGDVFEIQGGDSINASIKTSSYGTANPNVPSGSDPGPYPGDIVTFTATSSNPQTSYDVSWDFGNTESGSDNTRLQKTGLEVKHQYTGLTTGAKVTTTRTVRAVAVQDTGISSQTLLTLKLPTPRIGVSSQTAVITGSSSTPFDVVAGSTFKDASDGSVESHYGVWTIDGTPTKLKPNGTLPVGGVGPHTLKFEAFYGKYDDATFTGSSPYPAPAITIPYVVKPFRARLNAPTTSGTNIRFTAAPEFTTDTSILSAPNWTVSWSLTGNSAGGVATNAAVPPLNGVYPVGTIPPFDAPKVDVTDGSTVSLLITVDSTGLSTPAQPYAQASASTLLTTPNPVIEQVGCENANAPCTFTAKAVGGGSTSDWGILWTVKQGNTTVATSSANPYSPTLPQGNYVVTLKATKTVFEKEVQKSVQVQQSLCGSLPEQHQVTINKVGCAVSCDTGTTITFAPSYLGYSKQTCDTFSWTFGDGGTASTESATHAYTTSGTKTVTFKITNSNGVFTKTTTVTVNGSTPPPPPPPTCADAVSANFSYTGCNGNCRTTDSIKFTATKNNGASLQTCDSTQWTFGDTTTSQTKSPSKTYSTPGTYTVSLVVSNAGGTTNAVSKQIVVTSAPSGNCPLPGPGNFAVTYSGPVSGCSVGSSCQANEAIAFDSPDYLYDPSSCEAYEWDFGDGSPKQTTRTALHAYSNDGTYAVSLKVTTSAGFFTYTRSVTITGGTPVQPVPVLTATTFPSSGQKGKVVTFTATSNMPTTTGWTWNFGDGTGSDTSQAGTTSQTSTITHTFNSLGNFTVTAKARNSTDAATAPVGTAQGTINITAAPAIPTYTYLLPVAVHAGGLNNSSWRTDVQIYNPDPLVSVNKPLKMTATFKGSTFNLEVTKATHIYEDFLGRILDHDDQGPVIITTTESMVAPQIWTRTYNQAEGGGTFGQFIPAIRLDTAGTGGAMGEGKYYLSGLRHDDRYRTNVGFVNPNPVAINATVTVRDDRFLAIAQFTRSLQPFQLDQFTLKALVPTLPTDRPFSIQVEVPAGQWVISYASFIDSESNDPVFLQAIRESEVASVDHKVSIIPGVGHTGQWRSDVTIFNPDIENPVQFDIDYYDAGGTKLASAPGIVLDSRRFLQYSDILKQGVLGNVVDGLGTLKITATTPVPTNRYPMTFARTYFDDGANGTFGQGIGGFSAARPNVKVNKPALIPGVRNNAAYRTNIGLVNPTNATVTATITLLDPITGAAALSIPYTVKPNETIVGAFNGHNWNNIETGTLKIEANGDIWAFCSIIDKKTQDPEYVMATPAQ